MTPLKIENIREHADSPIIFKRGEFLQRIGAFRRIPELCDNGRQVYEVDGNYGNYRTEIGMNGAITSHCDCPYPGRGCKHVVAILLELFDQQGTAQDVQKKADLAQDNFLSAEEIREQALEDRQKKGRQETFQVIQGEMLKGDHLVTTTKGRQYQVTLHDPRTGTGHCSCPDFHFNQLGTCKHLHFLGEFLVGKKDFNRRIAEEIFPYIDIFWDSEAGRPRLFHEQVNGRMDSDLAGLLAEIFDNQNLFRQEDVAAFIPYLDKLEGYKQIRVQEPVMRKLNDIATDHELCQAAAGPPTTFSSTVGKKAISRAMWASINCIKSCSRWLSAAARKRFWMNCRS
ncbi:MAG: SWIM zinc finger family protein [Desulfoprunum sp.]|nr:SWIM zinc finger family protein [Desulfoprunum sp.]